MFDTSKEIQNFHDQKVTLPTGERTNMRQRRDTNRSRLKTGLNNAQKPTPFGMHTQGSYAMRTMVQDADMDYDIDDGAYFDRKRLVGPQGGEMSSLAVRQMVCDALQNDLFNTPPSVLKNCVRVFYNEGFHIDVPSYRRLESTDPWTGQVTYTYELASSSWKTSDPKEVTKWFRNQNQLLSPDFDTSDGQFCRIVRILKMFSRSRSSWKQSTASGFMITKLASDCFRASNRRDDICLRDTMSAIQERLIWNTTVPHPTLTNESISNDGDPRPGHFRDRLTENLKHLETLDSYDCSHQDAMRAWDKVFNTDWFSHQPEPGDDADTESSNNDSQSPTRPVEKKDGGRYARS